MTANQEIPWCIQFTPHAQNLRISLPNSQNHLETARNKTRTKPALTYKTPNSHPPQNSPCSNLSNHETKLKSIKKPNSSNFPPSIYYNKERTHLNYTRNPNSHYHSPDTNLPQILTILTIQISSKQLLSQPIIIESRNFTHNIILNRE